MKSLLSIAALTLVLASCASKGTNESGAPKMAGNEPEKKVEQVVVKETNTKNKKVKKTTVVAKEAGTASDTATTTEKSTTSTTEVACKAGSDERKLSVVTKDNGCELQYTKAGQTSTIASQIIGNAKCDTVMTNVKEKLIASGFNCQ